MQSKNYLTAALLSAVFVLIFSHVAIAGSEQKVRLSVPGVV
jgi:hypothetical protein